MNFKTIYFLAFIVLICCSINTSVIGQSIVDYVDIQSSETNVKMTGERALSYKVEIGGPNNYYWQQKRENVEDINITKLDHNGELFKDGTYTLQIKPIFTLTEEQHAILSEMRAENDEVAMQAFRLANDLPNRIDVFTLNFSILNGEFVTPQEEILGENRPEMPEGYDMTTPDDFAITNVITSNYPPQTTDNSALEMLDQVFADDVIVQGSLCVGTDCSNGEDFGFDTQRLEENNLRIHFDDTSNSASFGNNDWRLTANDSSNGGANYFAIEDATGGRIPFRVEAGAPNSTLYVEADGDVGIKTANPVVDLHIVEGNTATVRLEQDGSDGFTEQTWDLGGNEANFFIRDATNGSKLPFQIKPNAPTASIFIAADGDIGLGTASPQKSVHTRSANPGLRLEKSSPNQSWDVEMMPDSLNLSITDATNATTPLTIQANAANNSLYIDTLGRIGLGTAEPEAHLHLLSATPALRLNNSNNSQKWDVSMALNSSNLTIGDVTNSTKPLTIVPAAPTNSLYIAADGKIGVGTDQPLSTIHALSAIPTLTLQNMNNQEWNLIIPNNSSNLVISDPNNNANPATIEAGAPSHSLYIQNSGEIGLGTNNPQKDLHLVSSSPGLRLQNNALGQVWDLEMIINETTFALTNVGTGLSPLKIEAGAVNNSLYVDASGNVGIGTNMPGNKLHVNGHMTVGGDIIVASDRRFKKDIQEMNVALPLIQKLQPKQYVYRTNEFKNTYLPEGKHYGFLAQDIEQLLPELVNLHSLQTDETGVSVSYKGLDYSSFVPLVVKAMQEQQTIIDMQETEIEGLKSELEEMKAQLKIVTDFIEKQK